MELPPQPSEVWATCPFYRCGSGGSERGINLPEIKHSFTESFNECTSLNTGPLLSASTDISTGDTAAKGTKFLPSAAGRDRQHPGVEEAVIKMPEALGDILVFAPSCSLARSSVHEGERHS